MISPRVVLATWDRIGPDIQRLAFSFFLWELGFSLYAPLWSVHLRDLGAAPHQVGLIFSLSYLISTLSAVPGGLLADRFNRKRLMILFWSIGAPSALIFAFATRWEMTIPGVVLYFSSFMVLPSINAYVTHLVGDDDPAPAFAMVYVATPAVQLVGPTVGGLIAEQFGMRAVLLMSFICYIASTICLLFLSSQPAPRVTPGVRRRRSLSGNRPFLIFLALAPLLYLYFYMVLPFIGPYLEEIHGLSRGWIGALTSLAAAGGVIFTLLVGQAGVRWGRVRMLGLAISFFGIGVPLIGISGAGPVLVAGFLLAGCFYASTMLMFSIVAGMARERSTGRYFGAYGFTGGFGMILAPTLGGWLYNWAPQALFFGVGAMGAVLTALVAGLSRWLEEERYHDTAIS
ncbi:MAG: hypothetical protein KatS3mg057_1354 [Herpetosiphonaceae bacterium]|nr:MAG: hypothetical protein KatS3mg057_1354 [Herpetosiphonaceae bacterium]